MWNKHSSKRLFAGSTLSIILIATPLAIVPSANTQPDWRFGFEWNENWPWSPGWNDPAQEVLLAKLARVGTGGGINVNGMRSWAAMQSRQGAPIDFETPDTVVRLFQRQGFSMTWYLNCNARWAWRNPSARVKLGASMAPARDKEDDWQNYVRAIVERYDGDGFNDMPGLIIPIQFYIMTGEVRFDRSGLGDNEDPPFWADTIDNLLRLHRLTYAAVRQADPTGFSKLVSSGVVLWDLYADFPDYPQFDPTNPNSTIQRRLRGQNFKGSRYTRGWNDLKKMLDGFGNDADGIECDYIGWHPHFSWRVIDQEFALIQAHAGNKPIYVDDMWCNLFPIGYAAIPGEAQFTASRTPNRAWVSAINGDFPNALFTANDPYGELFQKLNTDDPAVLRWYYANGARRLVKSFVSAFGEGAERASFSGTNDTLFLGAFRGWELGWINLLGTWEEEYPEKPQYYTYKLLVEKLRDFTAATGIPVSTDPRTRMYRFDRPLGPVYIAWSETGEAPPNLDYRIPTGETVTFEAGSEELIVTRIITDMASTEPEVEMLSAPNGRFTIQLGYEPIILESAHAR
ncbi:MAG: hypothetical protein HY314_02470 [Acidobacteria bacterium]|nr:hypothetical protein [Acidobacteriota bacterium]